MLKSLTKPAALVLALAAGALAAAPAEAGGRGKEYFSQTYVTNKPLHGYEGRAGDNHHHLICRTCGRVEDVDCAVGARPCLTADDDHGYVIDEAEVIYWGHCPTCRASGPNQPPQPHPTPSSEGTRDRICTRR